MPSHDRRPMSHDAEPVSWDTYAATIVSVQIPTSEASDAAARSGWVDINGPNAVVSLPMAPPAYMLTAWNPMGRRADVAVNDASQARLVADLEGSGARWWRALGRAVDGSWAEEGFALSGVRLDEVLVLGRRYRQDAVFEVTEAEISILSCWDDRVLRLGRRGL